MKQKLLLLLLFLGMLPFSCGTDEPFYRIERIALASETAGGVLIPADLATKEDTVFFIVDMELDFLAQVNTGLFSGVARATTKAMPGHKGLKDKLTSISFTSDNMFNNRPARSELFSLLNEKMNTGAARPSSEVIDKINDPAREPDNRLRFILTELPKDSLRHRFTFTMAFESGRILSASTNLRWEKN